MIQRLILICLFSSLCTILKAQSPLEQLCNLEAEDETLKECLFQLMQDYDAPLSFQSSIIPEKKYNLQLKSIKLGAILDLLFEDLPLTYQLNGDQILLLKKEIRVAPRYFTISGFIGDQQSGEPLQGANIYHPISGKGTISNEYGFYSFTLREGSFDLIYSYVGHESRTVAVQLENNLVNNIELSPSLDLPQVVVIPRDSLLENKSNDISTVDIQQEAVDQLPSLGGEPDLLRVAHLLPGVQTGADGVGGIFVRGGSADQNLVLIDGVPIYNVFHAAGMFSVFNTNAIRSAKLVKGGFPARYGGRLSSVLDIRMKEGNLKKFKGQADIGLMTGRLTLEGPLVKDKASYFISARRSFVDWYLPSISADWKRINNDQIGQTNYYFYDINAKVNYKFSNRDKVYLSLYSGKDFFDDNGRTSFELEVPNSSGGISRFLSRQSYGDRFDWGNTVSSFRWNHIINEKLFSNVTLTYSKLRVDIDYRNEDNLDRIVSGDLINIFNVINIGRFNSSIEDVGGKVDFDFVPNSKHYVRLGFGLTRREFIPGALFFNGTTDEFQVRDTISNDPIGSTEYNFYLEDEVQISEHFNANIGVRLSNLRLDNINYGYLQPRLALNWIPRKDLVFKAAYSRMVQYLHLLSQSGFGLPSDLWVSSTKNVEPQTSWQVVLGVDKRFKDFGEISGEVYYKAMDNLINYTEGANINNNWEENITVGNGTAYGLELMFKKTKGNTTGWISYGLSYTNRTFEKINLGRTFPFTYDRRHDFKIALSQRIGEKFQITANWLFGTGTAFSAAPVRFITVDPITGIATLNEDFGAKNQFRLPNLHRLDISANLYLGDPNNVQHIFKFGIYNVYNRRNPLYYKLRESIVFSNGSFDTRTEYVEIPMLPFLPSVNYTIKF
jgi:outer membrane receptor for ferrienterochelin and colicin